MTSALEAHLRNHGDDHMPSTDLPSLHIRACCFSTRMATLEFCQEMKVKEAGERSV
jgi:hypothetical protein